MIILALGGWPRVGLPAPSQPVVAQAQTRLKALGYDPGSLDGRWGPKVAAAVRKFQQAQGLPVTGELDTATQEKLGMQAARSDKVGKGISSEPAPDDAVAYYKRGEAIRRAPRALILDGYQQAIAAFTKALELNPQYALPGSNGEIFGAKGLLVRADGAAVSPGVSIPPPR